MPASTDPFKTAAQQTYQLLKAAFPSEQYFWRCGHSFDTIVDYFTKVDSSDANNFSTIAIDKYKSQSGAWYDDFGWWGISGLKASEAGIFGSNGSVFASIATACWTEMLDNAPYGWERADQKTYAPYAPLVDGGVWNHTVDLGCHPGGTDRLCGRQNTVTNGLYLVLAQRLSLDGKLPADLKYRVAANQEYHFLKTWFDLPLKPALVLMNHYLPDRAVVRERVSTFKQVTPSIPAATDPAFRSDLAWAGDQGLILGGLVDRMRIVGKASSDYPELLKTARKLMAGTREYLTAQTSEPGILKPWYPDPSPGGDDDDYWTGPAVYMRYLLNAFENDDLRADLLAPAYQTFIRQAAEFAMTHTAQSTDTVVDLTNDLAALVAACVILAAVN